MARQPNHFERLTAKEERAERIRWIKDIIEKAETPILVDTLASDAKISYHGKVLLLREDDFCEFRGNGFSIEFHIRAIEHVDQGVEASKGRSPIIQLKSILRKEPDSIFGFG